MLTEKTKPLAAKVATLLHAERVIEAGALVADFYKIKVKLHQGDAPEKAHPVLQTFVHSLMECGGMAEAARILWKPNQFRSEPYSVQQVWDLFDTSNMGLIMGAAKMGKCLGPNESCRRADGGLVRAEDVRVGDRLAGDDGIPRTVLSTVSGEAEMYQIDAPDGCGFSCNGDHILSLVCTHGKWNNGKHTKSSRLIPGTIVDVPVREYLTWSCAKRRHFALFLSPTALPETVQKVDPYIYGAWLGDGTCCRPELTKPDGPMMTAWKSYWTELGFVVKQADKPITWCVRGQVPNTQIWPTRWFQSSVVNGEKRILPEYRSGSEAQRLQLLAGLVDSDGTRAGTGYEITSKWESFATDITELAQSLGFVVHRHARIHRITSRKFSARYYHVVIRGDVRRIPTKGKTALPNTGRRFLFRGAPVVRFTVHPLGVAKYAGFALDGNHRFLLASGVVAHNSFSMGVRLFLEWVRDPEWTSIRVAGPSENHLEENLFSHLVGLHQHATLPMPGEVGSLFIGLDRRNQLSSIRGVIIPKGQVKKAGRLQGGHRKPRKEPHPIFGPLSRLFLFLDEIENIPEGIWLDIDNVLSEMEKSEDCATGGFKIFGAYNPTDLSSKVAERAEPTFGWPAVDVEKHFRWVSKRGWDVIRIDGEKCENVVQKRIVYPGLQTVEGLAAIMRNAGGVNGAGYQTMGRGMYPSQSLEATVVPPGMMAKWIAEFIWYRDPQPVAAADLALEGSDDAVWTLGKFGLATGLKFPPSLEHPEGLTVLFKEPNGKILPRWGLEATSQLVLPKAETRGMTDAVISLNRRAGVTGQYFACDRTGHGAGVADLFKHEWSSMIHDVNYSEAAGKDKLMVEDSKTCDEQYERMYSVLWFAMRQWGEFQYFVINPRLDRTKLVPQITNRRFRVAAGRSKVESKRDYESRGFKSPNEADSMTLLVHAARRGSGLVLSMLGTPVDLPSGFTDSDDWPIPGASGGSRVDPSNMTDYLDLSNRTPGSMEGQDIL